MATLAANVMHGLGHGPIGAAVAAWPAVALVGSYELLMTLIRNGPCVPESEPNKKPASSSVPEVDPLRIQAADAFAEHIATGAVPTIRAIRAALRIGQHALRRYRRTWPPLAATERNSGVASRNVSLGSGTVVAVSGPDLGVQVSASGRGCPVVTLANGPPMARRSRLCPSRAWFSSR
jgi:hypothetical protein